MKNLVFFMLIAAGLAACGGADSGDGDVGTTPPVNTVVDTDGDGLTDDVDACPSQVGPAPTGCPQPSDQDSDGDGTEDSQDQCVSAPGPAANAGCPWPDSDGDGLDDSVDQCVDVFGPADNNGCPLPTTEGDADGDNVPDSADACDNTPGPAANNGCPWPDSDSDGVDDSLDQCVTVPGPMENNGCPWPDSDGDGVDDSVDLCGDVFGSPENNGCPLPSTNEDSDGDGVLDNVDECEDIPGPAQNNGCPWPDTDGDGVDDSLDQCLTVQGPAENNGCPWPDSDGDGLDDSVDECPSDAEGANGRGGCPDTDGDGKLDIVDECPTVPGSADNGCEESVSGAVELPGVIEAEDYDAFLDTTPGNEGGEYRNDDVDIGLTSDGSPAVGWIDAGEWLDYNIYITTSGNYQIKSRIASELEGGIFTLLIDEEEVGETVTVGTTGGWDSWITHTQEATNLSAGNHVLRIRIDGGPFNINWVSFDLVDEPQEPEEPVDTDGDGVPDQDDICPTDPGTAEGCPDGDGDGVADREDSCPTDAGDDDNMGCPVNGEFDLANGQREYEFRCAGCHDSATSTTPGTNVFPGFPASDIVGSDGEFNCTLTNCEDLDALIAYVDANMPPSGEECSGKCASDVSYYINQTFGQGIVAPVDSDGDGVPDDDDQCDDQQGPASNNGCPVESTDGAALYSEMGCVFCHGSAGEGVTFNGNTTGQIIFANWDVASMTTKISDTMPPTNPGSCEGECASAIAEYLMSLAPEIACNGEADLLPRRLRLLTPTEYRNTVADLLAISDKDSIAPNLPRTETVRGFDNNAEISVSNTHMDQYWTSALNLSNEVNINSLLNCAGQSQSACAATFVADFGEQAFRRPLSDDEQEDFEDLFNLASNSEEGGRYVVRGMLASPSFLYRSELGTASDGDYALTPYEVASLLSYTFWGSMPDATLLAAADSNQLSTTAQIRSQAERLLADDRAKAQLAHFASQWLHIEDLNNIDKDSEVYSNFSDELATAMETEIDLFISDVFLNGASTFADLFTADYTYANSTLADFYDISGVSGSAFTQVDAGDQRGGILNLAGFLASLGKRDQSSPILRGVYVREHLLCQEFATPPANVGEVEPLDPTKSTRDRFTAHTNNEGCSSCHSKIDPIGFSFERYDGIGQYRETEGNNITVDDSGTLEGLVNMNDPDSVDYNGTQGLANILAGAENAASCFVDHFHTYMEGVEEPDACVVEDVSARWKDASYTLYDLWLESVSTDIFARRQ